MRHRKAYMYINFQQNCVDRSMKTVHTNIFAKQRKLHKFTTCNSNFENHAFRTCTTLYLTFRPILRSIDLLDIKLPQ